MKPRIPDLILLAAMVAGGVVAWRSGAGHARLAAEAARLSRMTGDLRVGDPARVHIRAIDTGEPLHYAWRIYLPAGQKLEVRSRSGGGSGGFGASSSSMTEPADFIARVRLREVGGLLNAYTKFQNGSSRGSFGTPALAELVRGHEREVRVEQLGAADVATLGPDEPALLLRLALPDALQAEARAKLSPREQADSLPFLIEVKLGPDVPALPPPPPPGN